jgi:hypothetical protein
LITGGGDSDVDDVGNIPIILSCLSCAQKKF